MSVLEAFQEHYAAALLCLRKITLHLVRGEREGSKPGRRICSQIRYGNRTTRVVWRARLIYDEPQRDVFEAQSDFLT